MLGSVSRSYPVSAPAAAPKPRTKVEGLRSQPIRAKYDAAMTDEGNRQHWALADDLSARSANSVEVRRVLRSRARYEVSNNSYASGMVETLANDRIGTGPRLQMETPNKAFNRTVERLWQTWSEGIQLPAKLRTGVIAECTDGEVFFLPVTNDLSDLPVTLDIVAIEADQIAHGVGERLEGVDGIETDTLGRITGYRLLESHPGDMTGWVSNSRHIAARDIMHQFKVRRPGQVRGIPEITPALPLFALLRRYTLAVVTAAETAANLSGVIQTNAPADGTPMDVDPLDVFELVRGMFTTLPEGWQLGQMKAEHPTSTHKDFVRSLLVEIARCLNMPFNIAAGDSSGYNYASGRLDHQTYFKAIDVDRHRIKTQTIDKIFARFADELILSSRDIPGDMQSSGSWSHSWHFDAREHVDPLKVANANHIELATGANGLAQIYAAKGQDWETAMEKNAEALGVSVDEYQALVRTKLFGQPLPEIEPDQDDEEGGTDA